MVTSAPQSLSSCESRVEWPTWILLALVYTAWILLTLNWQEVPAWALWLVGGFTIALFSSLQHEAIHGHPTQNARLNLALVWPPLALWLSVEHYNENHSKHHATELTDPHKDPESFYVTPERWAELPRWRQWILLFHHTFAGRLLIGPPIVILRVVTGEFDRLRRGDYSHVGSLLRHAVSVAAVLYWVLAVCDIPLYVYILAFVWPGTSLMLVRSFLEHRYDPEQARRTVFVDGCPLTRLLFLNNNYHWIHHAYPGLAWYRIPAVARAERDQVLAQNGGYRYAGYFTIAGRYFLKPWTHPVYPA